VTRPGLALALAAWDEAGVLAGDRIEHGSVVPPDLRARVAPTGWWSSPSPASSWSGATATWPRCTRATCPTCTRAAA
jgi:hypothetical protein